MSYLSTNAEEFLVAVNDRGEKQTIPAKWLEHPILGHRFRLPPSTPADADTLELGAMTRAELDAYADERGVDTTGASTKADVLAAITAQTTVSTPDADETPATGDDEGAQ